MNTAGRTALAMIEYYASDVKRINHFLKVFGFAKAIGEGEGFDEETLEILELAALTHDIGIKNSELKYDSSAGVYQQQEGPPEARKLLEKLGAEKHVIDRVCWLIARHHTYTGITGNDYQALVEADFIVNVYEDAMPKQAAEHFMKKVFQTKTGIDLLMQLYL
jgi:HD superfamily phosphodiesterase